jgi:hypothetical protein
VKFSGKLLWDRQNDQIEASAFVDAFASHVFSGSPLFCITTNDGLGGGLA